MILLMERAAREALRPHLQDGEESVGTEVRIEHLAGAGIGATVTGRARVTRIDGRRIEFDVECVCGDRLLGRGTHARAIVPVQKLIDNLNRLPGADPMTASSLASNSGPLPVFETLETQVKGGVMTLTLNRPRVLNAVSLQMTGELEQLIAWLLGHPEDVRVVLLTGSGAAFCAGDDLKEVRSLAASQARELSHRQASLFLALERLPQIVIALVNGDALGAGCVAAYSADLRVAVHRARFGMPEVRVGWPPGYGLAQLTGLVGKARALELCLLGEPVSASTALAWGLVNEVVPSGQLLTRGHQLASRLLQLPATALREAKRLIHLDEGMQPKVAYRADTEAYVRCLELPDAREGLEAFAEKRPPKFTGR
jgi:enoyl-CoA hydratase